MQLQCAYCGKMFALNKDAALAAMYAIHNEGAEHYDAPCPHCQRDNRIAADRMDKAYPNWEAEYEAMVKEAAAAEKEQEKLRKMLAERQGKPKKEKKKRNRKR
jgi:glutaredoxin